MTYSQTLISLNRAKAYTTTDSQSESLFVIVNYKSPTSIATMVTNYQHILSSEIFYTISDLRWENPNSNSVKDEESEPI